MPKVQRAGTIDFRQAYECHGLVLSKGASNQAIGDCPFCEAEGKLYINRSNGLWCCKVCSPEGGNLVVFLRLLWDELHKANYDYSGLCQSRGLLFSATPSKWGVVKSILGNWLVPGFNSKGDLTQLYRYIKVGDKHKLLATNSPDDGSDSRPAHGIHRIVSSRSKAKNVAICEGVWDGMVLSEVVDSSWEVYAVPSCHIFLANWSILFAGKDIYLLYDNDHPDRNNKVAALYGVKRAASVLYSANPHPASLNYLKWGKQLDYYDSSLPAGYDIRDYLCQDQGADKRKELWLALQQKFALVPQEWVEKKEQIVKLTPSSCTSWEELVGYWKKAMCWPEPGESLDYGLSIMLACDLSVASQGELLWVRTIAPPSSGKSVLCEAMSVAEKYVRPVSDFNGLYSGYRSKDGEDNSLIAELKDMTVIIKDANTIQEHPRKEVFLAQFRDAYDGACRFHRGNRSGRSYEGYRFSMIWGCTSASKIDRSGLGERMLDCIILEKMDEETENRIGYEVAQRAFREARTLSNGHIESQMTPEMAEARRRTAGFIGYLRNNAQELLDNIACPPANLMFIQRWAGFISYMRAREWDSEKGGESCRELPFRLISQLTRLATCLAALFGRTSIDDHVMKLVRKVALDTSKGIVLNVARQLYKDVGRGTEARALAIILNKKQEDMNRLLYFLRGIEMVESFRTNKVNNLVRWRLAPRVIRLCESVFGEEHA